MHTKPQIAAVKKVGRATRNGDTTTISQTELDTLCDTATAGVDCADALAMWWKLRQDGYTTLRGYEIEQIEAALKKAGKL